MNILRKLAHALYGRRALQRFLKRVHRIVLLAMNYGGTANPIDSGELNLLRMLRSKYVSGVLLDVGANNGSYACMLANTFHETPIHSFEPSLHAYKALLTRTAHIPSITAHNFGLSDTAHTAVLFSESRGSGLGSLYMRDLHNRGRKFQPSESVRLEVLDNWVQQFGISDIFLLKIDTEGHELSVLKGATDLLAEGRIRYIQFEFGGCSIDSRVYLRDFWNMLEQKYRLYRVVRDGVAFMSQYDERDEVFTMTNYLAQRIDESPL